MILGLIKYPVLETMIRLKTSSEKKVMFTLAIKETSLRCVPQKKEAGKENSKEKSGEKHEKYIYNFYVKSMIVKE